MSTGVARADADEPADPRPSFHVRCVAPAPPSASPPAPSPAAPPLRPGAAIVRGDGAPRSAGDTSFSPPESRAEAPPPPLPRSPPSHRRRSRSHEAPAGRTRDTRSRSGRRASEHSPARRDGSAIAENSSTAAASGAKSLMRGGGRVVAHRLVLIVGGPPFPGGGDGGARPQYKLLQLLRSLRERLGGARLLAVDSSGDERRHRLERGAGGDTDHIAVPHSSPNRACSETIAATAAGATAFDLPLRQRRAADVIVQRGRERRQVEDRPLASCDSAMPGTLRSTRGRRGLRRRAPPSSVTRTHRCEFNGLGAAAEASTPLARRAAVGGDGDAGAAAGDPAGWYWASCAGSCSATPSRQSIPAEAHRAVVQRLQFQQHRRRPQSSSRARAASSPRAAAIRRPSTHSSPPPPPPSPSLNPSRGDPQSDRERR